MDVQAKLLGHLATRVAVPLIPEAKAPPSIQGLNPVFALNGTPHLLLTQALATVPTRDLRTPVCSLDAQRDAIARALDLLFTGF